MSGVSHTETAPALAGRKEWLGLVILALPTLLLSLDLGVLYLALPQLSAALAPSGTQMLWIMDIYAFMAAGFLITMGSLGDRIGRRRLLLIGAAAFGVASVLAAYAWSAETLILARALLGVAAATLGPSTLALITTLFTDARQRGIAIGVWMSCFMVGTMLGPIVGGLMLEFFWWGSVFLLGVPVMLLLLATGPFLLPESRDPSAGRLDLVSVALSLVTILSLVYGIKEFAWAGSATVGATTVAVGIIAGVLFVDRQRRLEYPLVDLSLFRIRAFAGALSILLLGPAVMGGVGLFANQYLQLVAELSPLSAGLWLVPSALATVVGAMSAPYLAQRVRPGYVVSVGAFVLAVGALLLTQVGVLGGLPVLVTGLTLVFLGFGPMASLGTDLVVGSAPPERAGSAASMSETSSELGVALGVGVLGALGGAVYRITLADSVPGDVSADQSQVATQTLSEATTVAGQVGGTTGSSLLEAAQEAFVTGLAAVAVACVVMGVVLTVLSAVLLRGVNATPGQDPGEFEGSGDDARGEESDSGSGAPSPATDSAEGSPGLAASPR